MHASHSAWCHAAPAVRAQIRSETSAALGTVVSVEKSARKISFDAGETHTYKQRSLHKFKRADMEDGGDGGGKHDEVIVVQGVV